MQMDLINIERYIAFMYVLERAIEVHFKVSDINPSVIMFRQSYCKLHGSLYCVRRVYYVNILRSGLTRIIDAYNQSSFHR